MDKPSRGLPRLLVKGAPIAVFLIAIAWFSTHRPHSAPENPTLAKPTVVYEETIKMLSSNDVTSQERGRAALQNQFGNAIPIELLKNPSGRVRRNVLIALLKNSPDEVRLRESSSLLLDPDPQVRITAIAHYEMLRRLADPIAISKLASDNEISVRTALLSEIELGSIADPDRSAALRILAADSDARIRNKAASLIAKPSSN